MPSPTPTPKPRKPKAPTPKPPTPTGSFRDAYHKSESVTVYLCPLIKLSHWNDGATWPLLGRLHPSIVSASWDTAGRPSLAEVCAELYPNDTLPNGWREQARDVCEELERATAPEHRVIVPDGPPLDRVRAARARSRGWRIAAGLSTIQEASAEPQLSFGLWEDQHSANGGDAAGAWLPEINVCYTFSPADVPLEVLQEFVLHFCLGMFQKCVFLEVAGPDTGDPNPSGWIVGPLDTIWDDYRTDEFPLNWTTTRPHPLWEEFKGSVVQWRFRDASEPHLSWHAQFALCRGDLGHCLNHTPADSDPVHRLILEQLRAAGKGGLGITVESGGGADGRTLVVRNCLRANFFFAPVVVPRALINLAHEQAALEHLLELPAGGLTTRAAILASGARAESRLRYLGHGHPFAHPGGACALRSPQPNVRAVVYAAESGPFGTIRTSRRVGRAAHTNCPTCNLAMVRSGHHRWGTHPTPLYRAYFHR